MFVFTAEVFDRLPAVGRAAGVATDLTVGISGWSRAVGLGGWFATAQGEMLAVIMGEIRPQDSLEGWKGEVSVREGCRKIL